MGNRVKLNQTKVETVMVMSEGNIGCATFLMEALEKDNATFFNIILPLDTLDVYGSKAYMLWNDCCDRDLSKVEEVLTAWRTRKLSREEIHENLSQGRGTPFNIR